MSVTEPIVIPIEGDPSDFVKDAAKVNAEMDKMSRGTKTASGANTGMAQAAKSASISITDLRSAYMIATDAARIAGQVWKATGGEFVAYAEQVKNLSRSLGASAEETSRLIQVADDVRISYDSLKVAMKEAQKDGVQPNIEGLAKLADQYKAIQSPTERTKFLLDTFGKSGLEMGKLLEKGGAGIRAMSADISDNLILTDKAIKTSDEYQKSMDALNDTLAGLKIEIGGGLVPAMNAFLKIVLTDIQAVGVFRDVLAGDKSLKEAANEVADIINENGFELWGLQIGNVTDETETLTEEQYKNAEATQEQADAVKAAENALKSYKDMLEQASQANLDMESMSRDIAKSQKQYAQDHADAAAQLSKAISEGDSEGIAKAQQDIQELEATWHEAANNMIYDMILVGVSAGGLLDSEQKALDEYAVKAGIKTQADIDEANRRREIADATIASILQSEDVLAEQRKIDAETLRLEEQTTTAASLSAASQEAAAMARVSSQTQAEIHNQMLLAQAAQATANAYSGIRFGPGSGGGSMFQIPMTNRNQTVISGTGNKKRDSGGRGFAGMEYMIGTGAQPEAFIPDTDGTFVPNADKKLGSGGNTYNIVVNNPKRETAENSIRKALKSLSYAGVAS